MLVLVYLQPFWRIWLLIFVLQPKIVKNSLKPAILGVIDVDTPKKLVANAMLALARKNVQNSLVWKLTDYNLSIFKIIM